MYVAYILKIKAILAHSHNMFFRKFIFNYNMDNLSDAIAIDD